MRIKLAIAMVGAAVVATIALIWLTNTVNLAVTDVYPQCELLKGHCNNLFVADATLAAYVFISSVFGMFLAGVKMLFPKW